MIIIVLMNEIRKKAYRILAGQEKFARRIGVNLNGKTFFMERFLGVLSRG